MRMIPLGEAGPQFRPEQDYFSISLVAVHMPAKALNTKFAPVVWASVRGATDDGRSLVGLFPQADTARPDFARNDRIMVLDLQLTPRIVAREELTVDFTLGAIREKDYVGGALGIATELASVPGAGFLSQIVPVAGAIRQGVQVAERLHQKLTSLLDADKLQALGKFIGTLRAPMASGLVAFTDSSADPKNVSYNEKDNCLMTSKGPMKSAYAVLRFQREEFRPDWTALPDVNQAWMRIREAALGRADILAAIDFFRITAVTSPDLTPADANRLVQAAHRKFAFVLESASGGSESGFHIDDPGDMAEALELLVGGGEESAFISGAQQSPFDQALAIVLEHEGGYVNHPADPGGATNKGVTQRVYDEYRARVGQPAQTVAAITDDELREIYERGYWRPAHCQDIQSGPVAIFLFDAAVNHGVRAAIRLVQQAAGVPERECDGRWGPKTGARISTASGNLSTLVEACLQKREDFYRRLVELKPSLSVFLRGWLNRMVLLRATLAPMCERGGAGGAEESLLLSDEGDRTPLVAAPPDFSEWDEERSSRKAAE
jgi:lysozyme family protein